MDELGFKRLQLQTRNLQRQVQRRQKIRNEEERTAIANFTEQARTRDQMERTKLEDFIDDQQAQAELAKFKREQQIRQAAQKRTGIGDAANRPGANRVNMDGRPHELNPGSDLTLENPTTSGGPQTVQGGDLDSQLLQRGATPDALPTQGIPRVGQPQPRTPSTGNPELDQRIAQTQNRPVPTAQGLPDSGDFPRSTNEVIVQTSINPVYEYFPANVMKGGLNALGNALGIGDIMPNFVQKHTVKSLTPNEIAENKSRLEAQNAQTDALKLQLKQARMEEFANFTNTYVLNNNENIALAEKFAEDPKAFAQASTSRMSEIYGKMNKAYANGNLAEVDKIASGSLVGWEGERQRTLIELQAAQTAAAKADRASLEASRALDIEKKNAELDKEVRGNMLNPLYITAGITTRPTPEDLETLIKTSYADDKLNISMAPIVAANLAATSQNIPIGFVTEGLVNDSIEVIQSSLTTRDFVKSIVTLLGKDIGNTEQTREGVMAALESLKPLGIEGIPVINAFDKTTSEFITDDDGNPLDVYQNWTDLRLANKDIGFVFTTMFDDSKARPEMRMFYRNMIDGIEDYGLIAQSRLPKDYDRETAFLFGKSGLKQIDRDSIADFVDLDPSKLGSGLHPSKAFEPERAPSVGEKFTAALNERRELQTKIDSGVSVEEEAELRKKMTGLTTELFKTGPVGIVQGILDSFANLVEMIPGKGPLSLPTIREMEVFEEQLKTAKRQAKLKQNSEALSEVEDVEQAYKDLRKTHSNSGTNPLTGRTRELNEAPPANASPRSKVVTPQRGGGRLTF